MLRDRVIIDVGPGEGASLIIPGVASRARILAFEPDNVFAEALMLRTKDLFTKREGKADGVLFISQPTYPQLSAATQLFYRDNGGLVVFRGGAGVTVSASQMYRHDIPSRRTTLAPIDLLLNNSALVRQRRVALLRVRARGFELRALEGARGLLSTRGRLEFLQITFNPKLLYAAASAIPGKTAESTESDAAVRLLDLIRASGRLCFQLTTGHVPTLDYVPTFTEFAEALLRPRAKPCPAEGCACELLCLPACSGNDEPTTTMLRGIVSRLLSLLVCDSAVLARTSLAAGSQVMRNAVNRLQDEFRSMRLRSAPKKRSNKPQTAY